MGKRKKGKSGGFGGGDGMSGFRDRGLPSAFRNKGMPPSNRSGGVSGKSGGTSGKLDPERRKALQGEHHHLTIHKEGLEYEIERLKDLRKAAQERIGSKRDKSMSDAIRDWNSQLDGLYAELRSTKASLKAIHEELL